MPLGIAWELECCGTHGRQVKGESWEREFQTRCQWNVKEKTLGHPFRYALASESQTRAPSAPVRLIVRSCHDNPAEIKK
jgi:hypothetical protein